MLKLYLNPVYHYIYIFIVYVLDILKPVFDIIVLFLKFFFLRLHIPTAFFLFPQAPSQSESESEKAPLCSVPLPPSSTSAEMSTNHAHSSASRISEDVDKEDEFGYSWSKLYFVMRSILMETLK